MGFTISKVRLCDGRLTAARYNYVLLVAWLVCMWSPHQSAGETKENARPR